MLNKSIAKFKVPEFKFPSISFYCIHLKLPCSNMQIHRYKNIKMNFLIAYVQIVMSKKSVQIVLSTKSIQIVRYALQKSVKVKCAVQKILSKFCPLDVI